MESLWVFKLGLIVLTRFYYFSSLDNDVLETSKRRVMFYNILSQIFIVKCFTKSLLIVFNCTSNCRRASCHGAFRRLGK